MTTKAVSINNISSDKISRLQSTISELDKVLCGGFAIGGAYLISGDPGIGKSTLLLQSAALIASMEGQKVLYVAGEETVEQISERAKRLNANKDNLFVLPTNSCEAVIAQINEVKPTLVIIDSAQTIASEDFYGGIGSLAQVKGISKMLVDICKANKIVLVLVAQITKDRKIAGPKNVEHLVDCVLSFNKDGFKRLLVPAKNRFGTTNVVGHFSMTNDGLVSNPPTPQSKAADLLSDLVGAGGDIVKRVAKNNAARTLNNLVKGFFSAPKKK
jgi:DNA repair protein RadA/Sms